MRVLGDVHAQGARRANPRCTRVKHTEPSECTHPGMVSWAYLGVRGYGCARLGGACSSLCTPHQLGACSLAHAPTACFYILDAFAWEARALRCALLGGYARAPRCSGGAVHAASSVGARARSSAHRQFHTRGQFCIRGARSSAHV